MSRVSSVVGLHRGPAREIQRALPALRQSSSSASISHVLLLLHLSPCGRHCVPRTAYQAGAGGRHLPRGPAAWCYGERASHVTCCVAASPKPPSGRSDAPDSWRAWRGVPHGPPTPSGARERRACVPRPRSNNGRSSARPAAAKTTATHWLPIRPTASRASLPSCTHLHGQTSSSYRRTSEQCFSAAHSPDPPAEANNRTHALSWRAGR